MGFGGISIWQLLIILVIVVVLFGTKRLRTLGGDLGGAIRSFRSSLEEGKDHPSGTCTSTEADGQKFLDVKKG
ncbi:twin-arginine translocase TatA/TatE family subunit [Pseudomonas oryzae]|uniref:Sec-independent protein translocase protein TatA n=1 Tax=Pseudomonas oryzae TaxID=1392877 RepID=A0A1H1ZHA6_9PSED|nr:twin-arginine translocase TatA/TatE family subunit [Pseudomonas oryzae]SDT33108.1 sec-independent protein translocase protein TatA [Pseudomonas oryzae]